VPKLTIELEGAPIPALNYILDKVLEVVKTEPEFRVHIIKDFVVRDP